MAFEKSESCPVLKKLDDAMEKLMQEKDISLAGRRKNVQYLKSLKICCGKCRDSGIRPSITRFSARCLGLCSIKNALPKQLYDKETVMEIVLHKDFHLSISEYE